MIIGNNTLTIGVHPATKDRFDQAHSLAAELGVPFAEKDTAEFRLLLICSGDGLALKQTGKDSPGPVTVSFIDATMEYRLKHGGGRSQALARAVGLKKGWQPSVIDATAGLGRDGFILAHLGCLVHMIERSPILAAMLADGLQRAEQVELTADTVSRIQLTCADSKEILQQLKPQEHPDVIFLDPMFPERTKSSLVKKEMQILQKLIGDEHDADVLLQTALQCAGSRVVVKRPRLAPALGGRDVSHTITGKTSRFDVYLVD